MNMAISFLPSPRWFPEVHCVPTKQWPAPINWQWTSTMPRLLLWSRVLLAWQVKNRKGGTRHRAEIFK